MIGSDQTKTLLRQKIGLVLFGLFLGLVVLEAGLRLGGAAFTLKRELGNMRAVKEKGGYRIMCVGESTTARQYPPFLEEILNQSGSGIKFSVIDKGIEGITTSRILGQLESNLDEYHPDMVVAMMGINDGEAFVPYESASGPFFVRFLGSLRIYKLARLIGRHARRKVEEIGPSKAKIGKAEPEAEALLEEGRVCRSQGLSSLAQEAFKQAIEADPQSEKAYLELAELYRSEGELLLAEEAFKKVLDLDPRSLGAYLGLGYLYRFQCQFPSAERAYQKAVEIDPRSEEAFIGLGDVFLDWGKLSSAKEAYKKAVTANPGSDKGYYALGRFYRSHGRPDLAQEAYEKAVEVKPLSVNPYLGLGKFYRDHGRPALAEETYKKALALNPQSDEALAALSLHYEETGQPELAREYEERKSKVRSVYCNLATINNYRSIKEKLDSRGVKLVCVQYPMRRLEFLRQIFWDDHEGIVFVDNEQLFKEAVKKDGYKTYFRDSFGGDFGHCTPKGNRLLAQNIADAICRACFDR